MKQLPAGLPAPDFELPTLDGGAFHLSQALSGGPVVLAFYKAACPTCQFTFPYLQKSGNSRIWAISQDEPEETRAFLKHFGIALPVLIDPHPYEVSREYGVEYVPAVFIIGQDGVIRTSDYGFSKDTLSKIAGHEMFPSDDGIPATRPG